VRIGIFKCGNIGTAPVLELLLDEIADRTDITVRTITIGSKMNAEDIEESLPKVFEFKPDLIIFISPNPSVSGPARGREILSTKDVPSIIISDSPGKRIKDAIEEQGLGYIIVMGDPLIGARREFLDPIEMAIFNAHVIKILAATGVYRMVYQEIDRMIHILKEGSKPTLPKLVIDTEHIREHSDFRNPYARAKAMAAFELAKKVAEINTRACFVEKEMQKYIPLVACSHEIVQAAARLAEDAREIEKYTDSLVRKPHSKDGKLKTKTELMLPPTLDEEIYRRWLKTLS
jgi:methylenetetrahydromethanopterin dehydrogenase